MQWDTWLNKRLTFSNYTDSQQEMNIKQYTQTYCRPRHNVLSTVQINSHNVQHNNWCTCRRTDISRTVLLWRYRVYHTHWLITSDLRDNKCIDIVSHARGVCKGNKEWTTACFPLLQYVSIKSLRFVLGKRKCNGYKHEQYKWKDYTWKDSANHTMNVWYTCLHVLGTC